MKKYYKVQMLGYESFYNLYTVLTAEVIKPPLFAEF